jgi:predicted nucleic acid-binding protein
VIPYDEKAAKASAGIERELRRKGMMINKADIFIAGVCVANDMILATFDKDFKKVLGLNVLLLS